ncbi:MAG: hypothetical protein MHPSP_002270, partial [Paramarteilia canceri]
MSKKFIIQDAKVPGLQLKPGQTKTLDRNNSNQIEFTKVCIIIKCSVRQIFKNSSHVNSIMISNDFITLNVNEGSPHRDSSFWLGLEENIKKLLLNSSEDHNEDLVDSKSKEQNIKNNPNKDQEGLIKKIENVIDEKIRPFLQSDGGDIEVV